MSFKQYEATEDLGKTGYFPFSVYKYIKLGNVVNAIQYEEKGVFDEYINVGMPFNHINRNTLFSRITHDREINVTVNYGGSEGLYIEAYFYHHTASHTHEEIIVGKTFNTDDHTMARAWQSAGNLYRFLNGWWE